jgi:type II secretory pathway component GspD/PulD (secretin)
MPESEQLLEVLIDGQPAGQDRAVIPAPEMEQQEPLPAPVVEAEDVEPAPVEEPAPVVEPGQATETEPAETEPAPVVEPAPSVEPEVAAAPQPAPAPAAPEAAEVDEIEIGEDDAAIAARMPKVEGDINNGTESLVDIECDDATLADVLRQFRKTTKANIISDDTTNLQKRVSISLHRVPWFQGMTAILNSRGFRIENRGGIYRVVEDKQLTPVFTRTYTLNHSSAKELADLFNSTFGRKDSTGKLITPVASSFSGANVVVVTSTEKVLSDCETIIAAVDKAVSQIYIEARFIEMSNEAMHKLGMQWNSLESWGASVRNISGGMEYNNGRAANYGSFVSQSSATGSSSSSASSSGESSASNSKSSSSSDSTTFTGLVPSTINAATGAGRSAESMAWRNARGFQGQLSVDDFRLAMSAFESMSDAKVFSNPKVIVSNGKEARVDMTTKYPNVTIDSNYTGQNSQNLSVSTKLDTIPGEDKFMFAKEAFFSWGIQLSVTPRISPDGLISVEIVPTISDCSGYVKVNSSQESDTPYTQYPIIDVKRLTTEFTMKDGATAVIGGLSRTAEEDVDSGIPFLRKIPWIGPKLFGWKSRGKVQKEIVVFVTVGIADPHNLPRDIGLPKNAIFGREYVLGTRLEPGDRGGTAANMFKLDKRLIDERDDAKGKKPTESGTVKITVVD